MKPVNNSPGARVLSAPYRWLMSWSDLFTMWKQFLNLKRLAEKTAAAT